jgi:hypothetical protein
MNKGPRIPVIINRFNAYINNMVEYLFKTNPGMAIANWQRLTLTAAEATELSNRRVSWRDALYPKYINPAESTSIIKKDVRGFIAAFRTLANPLLEKMASCGVATNLDAAELNFVVTRDKPSKPTTPIADECITALIPKTGGKMRASSRSSHDSKRASLAAGAKGVQYAYKIGGSAPTNPDDGTVKDFLSGSTHTLSFGVENVGKKIYIYTRWFNPSYPQFAGAWSDLQVGGVS